METILSTPVDLTVFGYTVDECRAQLNARYPSPDPRLTRVVSDKVVYSHRRCKYDTFTITDLPVYLAGGRRNDDLEPTIAALAKECGPIFVFPDCSWHSYDLEDYGCVQQHKYVVSSGLHALRVHYNPKGIKRARKAAITRQNRRAVRCSDISDTTFELRRELSAFHQLFWKLEETRGSLPAACMCFLEVLKWFEFIFGPKAYRGHKAFIRLKREWKARAAASRKLFMPTVSGYFGNEARVKLCNLMDAEIKKRNRPVRESWAPQRGLTDFSEFSKANYEYDDGQEEDGQKGKASKTKKGGREKAKR